MLSDDVTDRLYNWEFDAARELLESEFDSSQPTSEERDLVGSLATVFGNVGWLPGALGDVVRAAVTTLVPNA